MLNLKELESSASGTTFDLDSILEALKFNQDGLIPAVAQDIDTKEVLMLAWMDAKAIRSTLEEGQVCYYSRSRKTYWKKGEESGHKQKMVEMYIDCDGDSILLLVHQEGPACHTNRSDQIPLYEISTIQLGKITFSSHHFVHPVSYTHLTLPTKA